MRPPDTAISWHVRVHVGACGYGGAVDDRSHQGQIGKRFPGLECSHPVTSLSTTSINSKAIDVCHRKVSRNHPPTPRSPAPRVCVPRPRLRCPASLRVSVRLWVPRFFVIAETSASNAMHNPPRSRRLPPVAGLAVARILLRSIWVSCPAWFLPRRTAVVLLSHPAGAPFPVWSTVASFAPQTVDKSPRSTRVGRLPMIGKG